MNPNFDASELFPLRCCDGKVVALGLTVGDDGAIDGSLLELLPEGPPVASKYVIITEVAAFDLHESTRLLTASGWTVGFLGKDTLFAHRSGGSTWLVRKKEILGRHFCRLGIRNPCDQMLEDPVGTAQ